MSKEQWDAALAHSIKTWRGDMEHNEGAKEPDEPKGAAIRYVLGPGASTYGLKPATERGLLLLYLLDPKADERLKLGSPILAWAVILPGSSSRKTVSNADYMGNSVLWGDL